MFTGMELMACQNLAVSAEVMRHVVHVESHANPYAIGVVGGRLLRQPRNLGEALATVRMLDAGNYNYSLGLAQVNRANLQKYGLDSYRKAFMPCRNVAAGARILAGCYANSGQDWGKAFSCYYSGDFVTGFRDGYVRKIYDSINRGAKFGGATGYPDATAEQTSPVRAEASQKSPAPPHPGTPAYRVAIRSVVLDTAKAGVSSNGPAQLSAHARWASPQPPVSAAPSGAVASAVEHEVTTTSPASSNSAATAAFVPQVRGPFDPPPLSALPVSANAFSASQTAGPVVDQADLRKEYGDAAFVF